MIALGEFEIFVVSDGKFKLDGGAMFGVVPKVVWQRTNPANENNRIQLGLNCLMIKTANDLILVDTGIGGFHDAKFSSMFEIERGGGLVGQLAENGVQPEDVTRVILTHLHFDHCGGNCTRAEDGTLRPTFPNAVYHCNRGEFDYAQDPDARSRASYLAQNWDALKVAGQLQFNDGDAEIVPGISVRVTGGHTRDHQIVMIESGDRKACFLADLVPTDSHLKTPYVMGYDLYPGTTMKVKQEVLQQALAEQWLLLFEHAPSVQAGYLVQDNDKIGLTGVAV